MSDQSAPVEGSPGSAAAAGLCSAVSGSVGEHARAVAQEAEMAASLEGIYRRWDELRARHAHGGRILGWARRVLGRLRDLGIAWDLQRDLLRGLLDRQAAQGQRIASLDEAMTRLAGELAARTGHLESGLDGTRERLAGLAESAASLRDGQETLRARQYRLESATLAIGYGSSPGHEAAPPGEGVSSFEPTPPPAPATELTSDDLTQLLAALERDLPPTQAVELSVQDAEGEALLAGAHAFFGNRMSTAGPSYRAPNDLWIHVDFSPRWNRVQLLDNAAARLQPGGHFVLLTGARTGGAAGHPQLAGVEDRLIELSTGIRVRRLIWRRP